MLDAVSDLYAERIPASSPAAASSAVSQSTPKLFTAVPNAKKPAKEQPAAPTPVPVDVKSLAIADIRLNKDGEAPAGATPLTLDDLVGAEK
jgi:hypothetical protein